MANLIPFEGAKLPAYLKQQSANLNDELTSGVGQGFPYLSINAKNFTVLCEGGRVLNRAFFARCGEDQTWRCFPQGPVYLLPRCMVKYLEFEGTQKTGGQTWTQG